MAMFVNNVDYPKKWICCQCRFVTTNPITEPKMPKTKKPNMDNFWENMAKKSNKTIAWRSN